MPSFAFLIILDADIDNPLDHIAAHFSDQTCLVTASHNFMLTHITIKQSNTLRKGS